MILIIFNKKKGNNTNIISFETKFLTKKKAKKQNIERRDTT
jgi:hypothetical protein